LRPVVRPPHKNGKSSTSQQHTRGGGELNRVQLRKVENRPSPSKTRRKKPPGERNAERLTVDEKLRRLEEKHAQRRAENHERHPESPPPPPSRSPPRGDSGESTEAPAEPHKLLLREGGLATVIAEHDASTNDELTVFVGDVVSVKLSRGAWTFAAGDTHDASCRQNDDAEDSHWVLVQKGTEQGLVPRSKLTEAVEDPQALLHMKGGKGRANAAMAAKMTAKYDPIAEALAQHWIEQVTGHVFRAPFGDELKDGKVLCALANAIRRHAEEPCQLKIYSGDTPFGHMDNIAKFLRAAQSIGVTDGDTFETVDLYECRDLGGVVNCLFALSKAAAKHVPAFPGPFLRPADDADPAVVSNLKLIVAVNDYRDRTWHQKTKEAAAAAAASATSKQSEDDDADEPTAPQRMKKLRPVGTTTQKRTNGDAEEDDVVREAVQYRLAMLGLKDRKASLGPDNAAHAVDRADYKPPHLIVYSSSTKAFAGASEANERRLVHLLTTKKKRFEVVYVDVAPERQHELREATEGDDDVPFPALTVGGEYYGDFDALQGLVDDGEFDALIEGAEEGTGFWLLPDAWQSKASVLDKGGYQILNEVLPL